jgi:hypothetical protein
MNTPTELRVIQVLDHYDGTIEFISAAERTELWGGKEHTVQRCVYGLLSPESGVGSDDSRTYDCWWMPPIAGAEADPRWYGKFTKPDFQISEDALDYGS